MAHCGALPLSYPPQALPRHVLDVVSLSSTLCEVFFYVLILRYPLSSVDLACWLSPLSMQGAVAAGLWAATGPQSRRRSAAGSLLLALVGGTFTGAYLMWEFFPNQPLLQVRPVTAAVSDTDQNTTA